MAITSPDPTPFRTTRDRRRLAGGATLIVLTLLLGGCARNDHSPSASGSASTTASGATATGTATAPPGASTVSTIQSQLASINSQLNQIASDGAQAQQGITTSEGVPTP